MKNSRWRVNFLRSQRSLEEISPALQANMMMSFFWAKLLNAISGGAKKSWKATFKLNGQPGEFKVDTGADDTVIPLNLFSKLKPVPCLPD